MALKTLFLIIAVSWALGSNGGQAAEAPQKNLNTLVQEFNTRYPKETARVKDAIYNSKSLDGDSFEKPFKELLFQIYRGFGSKIKNASSSSEISAKDLKVISFFKSALEKLEYEENKTDQISDEIRNHQTYLESKTYHFKFRAFVDYLSWQTQATLSGPFEKTSLLATNLGICPGLGVSYENRFWAYSLDLSGLFGSGGISAINGLVVYQQDSVSAKGGKASLGAARVVASSGSELGLRGSLLYIRQSLTVPSAAGYSISQDHAMSGVISIFSRWRFTHFYVQTDFGRYVGRPATLWSLGLGAVF